MNTPQHSAALKELEPGYVWLYRGEGWTLDKQCEYAVLYSDERTFHYYRSIPCGSNNAIYYEKVKVANSTLEDKIQYAKDLIGKNIKFIPQNGRAVESKVDSWHITKTTPSTLDERFLVYKYLQDNDVCVYVILTNNSHVPVDSDRLEVIAPPKYKEVVLNGTYTAKVYNDKIEVGCQTFPVGILNSLINAHGELK